MYLACRHIKSNGVRCQSPALKGHAFCYFHSRLHATTKIGEAENMHLPLPENSAAVQLSIAQIFEALLASRIDPKLATQLLWGLQIALQTMPRNPGNDPESVQSVTVDNEGEELAPEERICDGLDNCKECKFAGTCTNTQREINEAADDDDEDEGDEDEGDEDEEDEEAQAASQ